MKINKLFKMDFSQCDVDFVNINVGRDNKLFLDGRALVMSRESKYFAMQRKYMSYSRAINSCFSESNLLVKSKMLSILFNGFVESSLTRLGFCEVGFKGSGVGRNSLRKDLVNMLISNSALNKGMMSGVHQMSLMVGGIGVDRLSDAITQVLTKELAEYTLSNCVELGVTECQLEEFSLSYFCDVENKWVKGIFKLPFSYEGVRKKAILFVPKSLVRDEYSAARTFNHFLSFVVQGPMLDPDFFSRNSVVPTGKGGKCTLTDKKNYVKINGGKRFIADLLSEQNSNLPMIDFEDAYRDNLPPALSDDELINLVDCGKKSGCNLAS